jgi:hypothetical protein
MEDDVFGITLGPPSCPERNPTLNQGKNSVQRGQLGKTRFKLLLALIHQIPLKGTRLGAKKDTIGVPTRVLVLIKGHQTTT